MKLGVIYLFSNQLIKSLTPFLKYNYTLLKIIKNMQLVFINMIQSILIKEDKKHNNLKKKGKYNQNKFEYKKYCESNFSNNQQINMKLKKFIVINRHGDRMPIKYEQKNLFKFINCVNCSDIICDINKCKEGDLTEKGYEQMEKLGKHISIEYQELLTNINKEDISLRTTIIDRTKNSLNGILKGLKEGLINNGRKILFDPDIEIDLSENLIEYPNSLNNSLISEAIEDIFPFLNELKYLKPNTPDGEIDSLLYLKNCKSYYKVINESLRSPHIKENVDETLVALCNDLYEPCEKYNCNEEYKNNIIKQYFNAWKEHGITIRNNNFLTKIYFGRFANELLNFIDGPKKMQIISSHDNSISLILAGFKTNFVEKPPLGSAIFLEIWVDNKNNEFLRIIFNDKVLKSDIFNNINIPLNIVREYAEIMNINQTELINMCKLT